VYHNFLDVLLPVRSKAAHERGFHPDNW